METGKVKKLKTNMDGSLSYGFIVKDSDGKDIFFHVSSIDASALPTIKEGDSVSFELVDGKRGPEASQVKLAGAEASEDQAA